ncbi:MAG: class I SAM-dependent methyltransferase [Ardenticatenaceae bacterium]|nr:class I SAM-dependent methyltransferase [Anaerolineales bacterium]MCB8923948.1 class I SAM-dependent methyltransferase [Ardenticatenaceae bacterium]MCB9005458.1 class I SAM-dependent methyltransferase [Ardenticatenaceae bacterium]
MGDEKEKYWSRFQDSYDKNQEYVVGKKLLGIISEKLGDLTGLGEVVEFGCGTGYFSEILFHNASQMIATDLSDELLGKAKMRLKDNPNVTFQKEDCVQTSFTPDRFDTVFMANIIHVIEHPIKALQESYRILKAGGILIIVTFTNHGMKKFDIIKMGARFLRAWGKPPQHTSSFSPESLASLMESAGFFVNESGLLGNKTKAVFMIGQKKQ